LDRQKPLFKAQGLDLDGCFNGTLNVSIRPFTFRMTHPEFTFRKVAWTDLHPPEDFSFSRVRVHFQHKTYDGWVCYPHPETKRRNFQDPTLGEIITEPIPHPSYGNRVGVELNPLEIALTSPAG